jgi:hypothetical protein
MIKSIIKHMISRGSQVDSDRLDRFLGRRTTAPLCDDGLSRRSKNYGQPPKGDIWYQYSVVHDENGNFRMEYHDKDGKRL